VGKGDRSVFRGRQRPDTADEAGTAAVEFALISILFFTLLFAMIQYSLYFWSTQSAANAARDAARRGAVGQTCAALQASVNSNVKLASGTVNVTRKYYDPGVTSNFEAATPTSPANNTNVRIVITYNSLNLHYPFVPFIKNGAVRETSLARVENFSTTTPTNWSNCP
jgi:Flp pilus assembly protein TadG